MQLQGFTIQSSESIEVHFTDIHSSWYSGCGNSPLHVQLGAVHMLRYQSRGEGVSQNITNDNHGVEGGKSKYNG